MSKLEENVDKSELATDTIDLLDFSARNNVFAEYKTDMFKFLTKKTQVPIRNNIFQNMNLFQKDTPDTGHGKEEFQILKLLEEAIPDKKLKVIRKFAEIEKNNNIETKNKIVNENSVIGIDFNDDVFNLEKIINIDPPEALQIIKHITTARNSSTTTTKFFILNELSSTTTKTIKANDTLKHVVNSVIIHDTLNNTKPIVNEANNSDIKQRKFNYSNKKPLSINRRDIKTSIEVNDDQMLKFEKILNRESEIIDILKRQTLLLEEVAKLLDAKEQEKEAMRSVASFKDFENILNEVNKKREMLDKGTNMTQKAVDAVNKKLKLMNKQVTKTEKPITTAVTTKQRILPTERTVIDETEVRNALRNDPYVKRILKMAKRKRTRYLKNSLM